MFRREQMNEIGLYDEEFLYQEDKGIPFEI